MGRRWGIALALCALTACGETEKNKHASRDTTGATGRVAGSTGAGGSAGFAGAAADSGAAGATAACADKCEPCDADHVLVACDPCICEPADSPDKPLVQGLAACPLDEPCPASRRYDTPETSTWQDGLCMLTAFRDRTVGKYQHSTRLTDEGYYLTNYTFLVVGDDTVLILRSTQDGLVPGENIVRTYLPVWSCTLKSPELLDSCVEAGTALSDPSVCDAPQDWFDTCETAVNPVCPGE